MERWARELAILLPALRPERYTTIRPPRAFAHRAGHVWEQLALPLSARRAQLLLSPANLAPLAHDGNVVLIHDAAPFREPELVRALIRHVAPRADTEARPPRAARDRAVRVRARPS